ncbi:hypothetical protein [Methylosinus sp. PW1]|uniref:hypothetical protein n=1 Tax=Methylosinus sp. PW1 TaxID=107636 RepID=UPI0012EC3CCA|nr:hypothetical protein [Methylosinus sp. PW1]
MSDKERKISETVAEKISEISDAIAAMYEGPITLAELQEKLLNAPLEVPGKTPPRDEKIYKLVYDYLHSKKEVKPEQSGRFAALSGGGWICVGREIGKLLATMPDTSLQDLVEHASKSGFTAEVVAE